MKKSRLLGALCACLSIVPISANATVLNTLNGINYEWLEVTATAGMSRDQVEAAIAAATTVDALYGYEYASRSLVEDLLLSYASWDGLNGWYGEVSVVTGFQDYFDDFGYTYSYTGDGTDSAYHTNDGYDVEWDGYIGNYALYGLETECLMATDSCYSKLELLYNTAGTATMAWQNDYSGWDSASTTVLAAPNSTSSPQWGSYLVKVAPVPIPAAIWLFGSGLLGLVGMARRKKTK